MNEHLRLKRELLDCGFVKFKSKELLGRSPYNLEYFIFKFNKECNNIIAICIWFGAPNYAGFRIIEPNSKFDISYHKVTQLYIDLFTETAFFNFTSFDEVFELASIKNQKFALLLLFNKELFESFDRL